MEEHEQDSNDENLLFNHLNKEQNIFEIKSYQELF